MADNIWTAAVEGIAARGRANNGAEGDYRDEEGFLCCGRTKIYYCHPYSSYERGSNENVNKMIRRWFPKGTDFRKVTAKAIQKVEDWINNYPREILGFRTAEAVFQEGVACLI